MKKVKVWRDKKMMKTYIIGKPNKEPQFLDKRVYQGSSGKVYPHSVIDKITDKTIQKIYDVIYLENEYLKIMVMPELGGRIQEAYDKVNNRYFVYKNDVIKPALVGLSGPWISGGIEFNWPQHHRPSTFDPVDSKISKNADKSASIFVGELEKMYRMSVELEFRMYPGKSYLEINGKLYNGNDIPKNFLWWANPAISASKGHQSIFPLDVTAVFDHGKRDSISFPIAYGKYYKMDYSKGVDISRYENILVPTSYMAWKSEYDFVGAFEHDENAGLLHIANHHIVPGKKQWTWGNGNFGFAWDRNLTDTNGPYIELMTGAYCDNQPDFSWLDPYEEKRFTQYFMPYSKLGELVNANKDFALKFKKTGEKYQLGLHSSSVSKNLVINLLFKDKIIKQTKIKEVNPALVFNKELAARTEYNKKGFSISVFDHSGIELINWTYQNYKRYVPEPLKAPKKPKEYESIDELLIDGEFVEQYKYATANSSEYYSEALRRDIHHIKANLLMTKYLYKRGDFKKALICVDNGLKRLLSKTQNPYDGELIYYKGLIMKRLGNTKEGINNIFKSAWNGNLSSRAYTELAIMYVAQGKFNLGYEYTNIAINNNLLNQKAHNINTMIRRILKLDVDWKKIIKRNHFNHFILFEKYLSSNNKDDLNNFMIMSRLSNVNVMQVACLYIETHFYKDALKVLNLVNTSKDPMIFFYKSYCETKLGKIKEVKNSIRKADELKTEPIFPNSLEDIKILELIINQYNNNTARYQLGNLFYDKGQYKNAAMLWEQNIINKTTNYIVYRNLAIYKYNFENDGAKALEYMKKALDLAGDNTRLLFEFNDLLIKLNHKPSSRLKNMTLETALKRDDLAIEYIKIKNILGELDAASKILKNHKFHPWEGGEGKVVSEYVINNIGLAFRKFKNKEYKDALKIIEHNLKYPRNLGEGKLIISTDNETNYLRALIYETIGNKGESLKNYKLAMKGLGEIKSPLCYNDQPAEYILFQALAHKKMGKLNKWKELTDHLINYGKKYAHTELSIDFFTVSFPNTLVFNRNLDNLNNVHAIYLQALGYLGKGNKKRAKHYIKKMLDIDSNHNKAHLFKNYLIDWIT